MDEIEKSQWKRALRYLCDAEEIYSSIGIAGTRALIQEIGPLRLRVLSGERTQKLIDDIFSIEL